MLPRVCDKENVCVLHRIRTSDLPDIQLEALTTHLHIETLGESSHYIMFMCGTFISFHFISYIRNCAIN